MFPKPIPAVSLTVAYGDGVGPEVIDAALHVMREAGASLAIETIQVGQRVYDMQSPTGVMPGSWDPLERSRLLMLGPVAAPPSEAKGVESVIRNKFELYEEPKITHADVSALFGANADPAVFCASITTSEHFTLIEGCHGCAHDIAGKNIANPSGYILAGVLLLAHIGQVRVASMVHNAWLRTLEQGYHTADLEHEGFTKETLGTFEFAEAVVQHLGRKPAKLACVEYKAQIPAAETQAN